jgi:hypothetical protein
MLASYLAAEQDRGRIVEDADIQALAPTLIGGVHLLYADRGSAPPQPDAVRQIVRAVLLGVRPARLPDGIEPGGI